MIIKGNDYVFTPINEISPLYDVDLMKVVNKGKANERQELQKEAYGVPLDYAIRMVVNHRIRSKAGDSVVELQDYIQQFRKSINELKDLVYAQKEED